MNQRTQKFRKLYWSFKVIDIILSFGPVLYFLGYGLATGSTQTKLVITMASMIGILLTIWSLMMKYRWKSPILFLIVALTAALEQIRIAILVIAICTFIDELVIEPLTKKFALKLNINKEMDKREANS